MHAARVLDYGADGVLVEFADAAGPRVLLAALESGRLSGLAEAVPGARTVLLAGEPGAGPPDRRALRRLLAELGSGTGAPDPPDASALELPVRYDGADLVRVAELCGLRAAEVGAAHAAARYRVAFTGFGPGFGYLDGLPSELRCPRLDTPRTRVPAGAVGVADRWTGIYPRPMPGGWNLIGSTSARLWDPTRNPPALLTPGRLVRFVPAR